MLREVIAVSDVEEVSIADMTGDQVTIRMTGAGGSQDFKIGYFVQDGQVHLSSDVDQTFANSKKINKRRGVPATPKERWRKDGSPDSSTREKE
jgi:hypothetical protein